MGNHSGLPSTDWIHLRMHNFFETLWLIQVINNFFVLITFQITAEKKLHLHVFDLYQTNLKLVCINKR